MRAFVRPLALSAALVMGLALAPAHAQNNPEDVDVKITVRAQDGTFIGTAMGGAYVVVRDRRNGDILAEGVTAGTAGDAAAIMDKGFARDAALAGEGTAKFEFSVAVFEPTPVEILARAPLAQKQAEVSARFETYLIPGKDYSTGNGIMVTLPGFAVDITDPLINSRLKHDPEIVVPVRAAVAKLSGERPAKDGPWPASRYEVDAHVFKDSAFVTSVRMRFEEKEGLFAANMKVPLPGTYRVIVSAYDPQTKESGVDSTTMTLE